MNALLRWMLAGVASSMLVGSAAVAQPKPGDKRPADYDKNKNNRPADYDKKKPEPPPAYPKNPPPAPRAEAKPAKAGHVWISGRWDWKNGKWEWIAGHHEPERKGKKWTDGRWEKKGDTYAYIAGTWADDLPPSLGPKTAPPPNKIENSPPRKGFTYVPGRWVYQNNKWEWQAGKYEAERPGKKWREGKWEKKGDIYAYVEGDWIDDAAGRPKQAPPPNKVEKSPPRKGYVYIPGRWDWRNGKWEWENGKYEPEQPGKKYREGRWDKVEDGYTYFEGGWIDDAPTKPDQPKRRPRVEKPIVGNYFPDKGKAGTRVVVFGRNFSPDAKVLFAGQPLRVRVTAEQISFRIPDKATSGDLVLRDPASRRDLDIGPFQIVADYDPVAEQKKIEEERLKAAQAAIAARQAQFAAARAAREQAYKQRAEEYAKSADKRREERIKWYTDKWEKAFLASEDVKLEMTLHCQRLADIHQMLEVAELANNVKVAVRIDVLRQAEDARHEKRMDALKAKFKGGAK